MNLLTNAKLPALLKTILWVVLVQLILLNISAASYAYRFTHFKEGIAPVFTSSNIISRTWKLFVGPRFYKNEKEPLPSFPFESIQLKLKEGQFIDAWYSTWPDSRKCIIMFHGYSSNKSILNAEAFYYRSLGYNVLMVDIRAHGKSEGACTSFGYKETEEVRTAFEFCKSQGNHSVVLYGVSMGAVMVMKAVADGEVKPAAIIADMPFASLHDHLKARARVTGFISEPFAFFITMWIGIEGGFNGFDLDTGKYARSIDCPVLLQWGEQDRFVTRKEIELVYSHLPAPKKKLVVYPEADHDSYLASDPIRWKKEVGAFLNALQ
jgi:alpha-beta hydrolase superfamily lysophospholipase